MKTQTNQPMTKLIAVTSNDTAIFKSKEGKVNEQVLMNDSEGKIYFLDGVNVFYLPQEFQPRLFIKN